MHRSSGDGRQPPGPLSPRRPSSLARRLAAIWADEYDTLVNWPNGPRHLVTRAVTITVVDTVALLVADWLMPSITIGDPLTALAITVVAGLITFLARPAVFLVVPHSFVVTPLLTFLFMGLSLTAASWLVGAATIDVLSAMLASLVIAGINAVLTAVLGLDEDESFYRNVLRRLARVRGDTDDRPGPGFVIIQVDGLSNPVMRHAIRTGTMPFLAGWLRNGSHRLGRWEATVPSMTSAGQAGILHGDNSCIPAFRWWEKEHGRLMVSNRPRDALEVEGRISGPRDLLRDGGASISNLFSGGAARSIATNSQLAQGGQGLRMEAFALYLLNPYNITRGIVTFLATLVVEHFQARHQRVRDVQPRIHRGWPFPFLRAATTTILRDMVTDLVIAEMARGTPVIYATFLGYDEVAHHAGPERAEAMDQLDRVDRLVRSVSRAAERAPRRYHFVLLSDHGQSQGLPFSERFGMTLEQVVRRLLAGEATTLDASGEVEGWGAVNAFLTELTRVPGAGGRVARRALAGRTSEGVVSLHPGEDGPARPAADVVPDVVVAASGNLANVYFTEDPGRLSLEEVEARHPGLVLGLVRHPGVGFVLVRSERWGPLVVGDRGVRFLDDDRTDGEDPLAVFGRHAADGLRRLDRVRHVGDLLVNSAYDPSADEIVPFEHQLGAHGGLGGDQTKAFIMYPAWLEDEAQPVSLVGAEAVNERLHAWMARAREAPSALPEAGAGDGAPEPVPSVLRTGVRAP
jgi:uncharacterized membrane protein YvlD (DUF360 family)